ncbi:YtzI protein [Jeotgalibacillus sp. S-D1]|uniref:YtzI protein n=1 Tax=Jeotgalibacillus sp. S-D1 TaxID=2552189 RepID=UPI001F0F0DE0|nr:YtzI protein [Jeotgalibacillus sp. S-D1]
MSLTWLMILSILVIIFITLLFIIATNRGYKYEHTVDPLPTKNSEEQNSSHERPVK